MSRGTSNPTAIKKEIENGRITKATIEIGVTIGTATGVGGTAVQPKIRTNRIMTIAEMDTEQIETAARTGEDPGACIANTIPSSKIEISFWKRFAKITTYAGRRR